MLDGKLQCLQADAIPWMRGNLERAQSTGFERLKCAEIGRRLNRHNIARTADRMQAEVNRFGAARGDQDIAWGKMTTRTDHPARDLNA